MPNQNNFRSDVTTNTDTTYLASRIVRVPEEPIFLEEVVGSFGYDNEDNIEVHFYSIPGNQLILSAVIKLSDDIIRSQIVSYEDGTFKHYIRIDFTKLFEDKALILVPSDYRMVLNFFSDEIGDYDNRILTVTNISTSRTEVELEFNNLNDEVTVVENQELLKEFVEKSFIQSDAVGVAEKIFKSGVELDNPTEGVTSTNVINNINIPSEGQTFDNTIARIERINVRTIFEQQLDDFIVTLYEKVREKIVVEGDERIQEPEFQQFINDAVNEYITNLRQTVDARIKIR